MKKQFTLFLLLITAGISYAQKTEYAITTDIKYYPESTYKNDSYKAERCILDVYYPKDKKGFATIIWFHGGGITSGSKEIPQALKDKGYAIIGVGYRLHPKVKAPVYIEDAAAAIAWAFNNIEKYGGDPSLIFLSGHSAGGYLDLMVGLDKQWLAKYNIDANKVAGLIPFSPQCVTHFTVRKEQGIPEKQPTIDKYAPLFHVRGDMPPILLITGNREMELLGRYEENAYFERMMKLNGQKDIRLFEIDGYGHNMADPAYPLLLNEVKRVLEMKKK
ncbi:alpha/beta hydrolase [Flavobacterium psychrotrophum]|uniref:alpha/beta hydrolase n=1 Tax=Flavobacterium psychrotrophum TaxID=2294119 RepID=UPI000E30D432|nr:alpha/beta hydrolase [Flavobacterium psychrotrophum]